MTIKRLLFISALAVSLFSACGDDPVSPENNDPNLPVSSAGVLPPSSSSVAKATIIGLGANPALVDSWYPQWKQKYIATLEDDLNTGLVTTLEAEWFINNNAMGAARVKWNGSSSGCNASTQNCTVSEGIGYGMLITLFQEDWETFHGLYLFNHGGLTRDQGSLGSYMMPWIYDSFFTFNDASGATDADLDIATALVLAHIKLSPVLPDLANLYLVHAQKIINSIWNEVVMGGCSQNYLVCAGNTSMWYKEPVTFNLSYFSPVAFRLFSLFDPTHDWDAVVTQNYAYMKRAQSIGVGLVPDWSDVTGTPMLAPNNSSAKSYDTYGKESVRTAWRIAWDYYWFESPDAKEVLDKMAAFVMPKFTAFSLAGMPNKTFKTTDGTLSVGTPQSVAHLGSYCLMAGASHPEWYQACVTGFNAEGWNPSFSYFTHILQMMFGQLMNGKYVSPF